MTAKVLQKRTSLFPGLTEKGTEQGHLRKMLISAGLKLLHWHKSLSRPALCFCRCVKPCFIEGFSSALYFGRSGGNSDENMTAKKLKGNTATYLQILFSSFQHSPSPNFLHLLIASRELCLMKR